MQPLLVDWSDRQLYPVGKSTPNPANKQPAPRASLERSWKHWLPLRRRTTESASVSPPATARLNTFSTLTGIAGEIAAEGQQAFSALMQLAKQTKASADRLRQQTTTLDDLQRLATETGQCAQGCREQIVGAQTLIRECAEVASGRTHLVRDLLANVHESETNFSALNDRIDQVECFVATIQQIGSQTSLLALNAAIEASRAGVQGTGFNVVAREMRMLADRTEAATQEILNITQGMRQSSAATSASMQEAVGWSRENEEIGQRAIGVIQRCSTMLGEAETAASQALRDTEAQSAVIDTFREDWRTLREGARQCTFAADAAAERTIKSISLAAGLNESLAQLATEIPAESTAERFVFDEQSTALRQSAAVCSRQTGLAELKRFRPHILRSLEELLATCASLGPASRHAAADGSLVPELCFGATRMNGNYAQIDSLSRTTGLLMTLMVLSKEKNPLFHRIATSVRRSDGQRAIATELNPITAAAQKLLLGESMYGYVYALGLPHLFAYTPIFDTAGQVIGAACAGMAAKRDGTAILADNTISQENTWLPLPPAQAAPQNTVFH